MFKLKMYNAIQEMFLKLPIKRILVVQGMFFHNICNNSRRTPAYAIETIILNFVKKIKV